MILRMDVLNYRSLRHVGQNMNDFQVLIGPNASGKTSFIDALAFLSDLVKEGLDAAVTARSGNARDLIWQRKAGNFEIAIELLVPENQRKTHSDGTTTICRYEVAVSVDENTDAIGILRERVLIEDRKLLLRRIPRRFGKGGLLTIPNSIFRENSKQKFFEVVNKTKSGKAYFAAEVGAQWKNYFQLGARKSALANLPDDVTKFPIAIWLKETLSKGVRVIRLNSQVMQKASPPGKQTEFLPDGSNIPWVVEALKKNNVQRFNDWLEHVRTFLPDVVDIKTILREEDRHRYLMLHYNNGLQAPSWTISDGTLRLLALTLIAYIEDSAGIYMVEEPENGVHPKAIEAIYQSLTSVYNSQVLMTTHSPVFLALAEPDQLLCFSKNKEGATVIVKGADHPALQKWRGGVSLGSLFAGGVLG